MIQTKAFLLSKKIVAPDVYHLYFSVEGEGIEYKPGQYVILTIPASPTPLKRLYSFAGPNKNKNVFELLVRLIPGGFASEYIRTLAVGKSVEVSGPAGLFCQKETPARKIYMATGTGFAPIRSFLQSAVPGGVNAVLYWGLTDMSEVYLFDELLSLKEGSPAFSFTYCLSRQASFDIIPAYLTHYFRAGHIDAVWAAQSFSLNPSDEYYLCGSRTVIESLRTTVLSRGVPQSSLFYEKY